MHLIRCAQQRIIMQHLKLYGILYVFWKYGDIVRVDKGKYHMNMTEKISDEIIAKVGYHLNKFIRLL